MRIIIGGRSQGKSAYYSALEQEQVKQRWLDGYSIQNIALLEKVSVEHACRVLGFGYKGARK